MVKYGVTDEQLDRGIEQDDLAPVAMHFDNVELYLNSLKLTVNEQVDVKNDVFVRGNHIAVKNCLSFWKGHEPSEATFRALIRILWDLRKEEIVTNIFQYLKKKKKGVYFALCVQYYVTACSISKCILRCMFAYSACKTICRMCIRIIYYNALYRTMAHSDRSTWCR